MLCKLIIWAEHSKPVYVLMTVIPPFTIRIPWNPKHSHCPLGFSLCCEACFDLFWMIFLWVLMLRLFDFHVSLYGQSIAGYDQDSQDPLYSHCPLESSLYVGFMIDDIPHRSCGRIGKRRRMRLDADRVCDPEAERMTYCPRRCANSQWSFVCGNIQGDLLAQRRISSKDSD